MEKKSLLRIVLLHQDLTHQDKKKAEELREASILDNDILHEDSHAHVRQEMGISEKD